MSEQKSSHEVKGIVSRAPRHRSGERYQNNSAALKVPKNTVVSIILKWKMIGNTKTLPGAGRPAKLSNRERRSLIREVKGMFFRDWETSQDQGKDERIKEQRDP
jgi:hypothetical protein